MCEHRCPDFAILVDYDVDEEVEKELEARKDHE
jgi:hypothetical protein